MSVNQFQVVNDDGISKLLIVIYEDGNNALYVANLSSLINQTPNAWRKLSLPQDS